MRARHAAVLLLVMMSGLALSACGQTESSDNADTASGNDMSSNTTAAADNGQPALLDAKAIRDRIIDHTVAGEMSGGASYGEYYAPDGNVLADDYTAHWQIDHDRLCLDYGKGPTCYGVALDGNQARWYVDGSLAGRGKVEPGNPNDFTAPPTGAH